GCAALWLLGEGRARCQRPEVAVSEGSPGVQPVSVSKPSLSAMLTSPTGTANVPASARTPAVFAAEGVTSSTAPHGAFGSRALKTPPADGAGMGGNSAPVSA